MGWMLGGGVVLLGLIVMGIVMALNRGTGDDTISSGVVTPGMKEPTEDGGQGALPPTEDRRSDASILVEAESLVGVFLNAKTINELLPVVRDPDRAKVRMQREYPDGRIDPPGMAKFNPEKGLVRGDSFLSVTVRTRDFEVRHLNLVETPLGLRVDWESWVGWTEMSWPDFLETKPTTPKTFRVVVRKVDYYNFGFSDDLHWRSFLLESRKGEETMYGYVERGSELEGRILIDPELKKAMLILKVRFPAGAPASSKQVLIDEVVHGSWVEPDEHDR
jgi:hypothetical protein